MNAASTLTAPLLALSAGDWLQLFLYYLSLSLLAVGGAIATAPDMHRFLVERQAWLTDPQFNASIAIAQAAPGPNVLFIALLGWNVGLNAGGPGLAGWLLGAVGMAVCMLGIMLPSSLLTWTFANYGKLKPVGTLVKPAAAPPKTQNQGKNGTEDKPTVRKAGEPPTRAALGPGQAVTSLAFRVPVWAYAGPPVLLLGLFLRRPRALRRRRH